MCWHESRLTVKRQKRNDSCLRKNYKKFLSCFSIDKTHSNLLYVIYGVILSW